MDSSWDRTQQNFANVRLDPTKLAEIAHCADPDRVAEEVYSDDVKCFYRRKRMTLDYAAPPGYLACASIRSQRSPQPATSSERWNRADAAGRVTQSPGHPNGSRQPPFLDKA
jgi:hypothetical protein